MKKLIKTLPILIVFVIVSGFGIKHISKGENAKENRIEVVFNRTFKFNDLVKIKLDLAEKGISFYYKKLEFDENGGFINIGFKVDCNDGFSGSAQKSNLINQSKYGFYRDYSEDANSPFGTGVIEHKSL